MLHESGSREQQERRGNGGARGSRYVFVKLEGRSELESFRNAVRQQPSVNIDLNVLVCGASAKLAALPVAATGSSLMPPHHKLPSLIHIPCFA